MWELERTSRDIPPATPASSGLPSIGIVGCGRLGNALANALRRAGRSVIGPARRGEVPAADALVLCVPDDEIEAAARVVAGSASIVGHTSGATPLSALAPSARAGAEVFGLHPLQTFTARGGDFAGAACAVAASSADALSFALSLARTLAMTPFEIDDSRRAAYHAAASIASNFLLTLEDAAESVAAGAGVDAADARRLLGGLVETTVSNWLELGPEAALTGPVARGDEQTVSTQRAAVAEAQPALIPLWDALVERTVALRERTRYRELQEAGA